MQLVKPSKICTGHISARTRIALLNLKANFVRRKVLQVASRLGPGCYSALFFLNQTSIISETPKVSRASLFLQGKGKYRSSRYPSHTTVVQPVQLHQVIVTEVHSLANHIFKVGDPCDDGGLCSILKSCLTVVHDRGVVIGNIQGI